MLFSKRIIHYMKLVDVGDFTRAAETLNITTSALRHSIVELEKYCGEKLLVREKKRVRPTHAGNLMYEKLFPLYEQSKEILQYLPININNKERCLKVMLSGFHYPGIPEVFIKHTETSNILATVIALVMRSLRSIIVTWLFVLI